MDDNNTGTKRAIGLFIIIIMFFSIVGYGLISSQGNFQNQPQQPQNQPNISIINVKELSVDEKIYVFSLNRVLFEHFYPEGCTECLDLQSALVNFTVQFQQNVVLETVSGFNQTSLNMFVYRGGDKVSQIPIETNNLTLDSLIEFFCSNSPIRPKECLFREFGTLSTPEVKNNTETNVNTSLETENTTNTIQTNVTINTNRTNTTTNTNQTNTIANINQTNSTQINSS